MNKRNKDQELFIREVRAKRLRLAEKKARRERREERLATLAVWLFGLGMCYLFLGVLGLGAVAVYAFIRYFILGAESVF